MTREEKQALEDYVARVRDHFGSRLHDIVLFGSRARGDHGPESDVDLAIILKDHGWSYWEEKFAICDLSCEALMDAGLVIQGWPVSLTDWLSPKGHSQQKLIEAMKRDGRAWREAA